MAFFFKVASNISLRPAFSRWSSLFEQKHFYREMGYDAFIKFLGRMPNIDLLCEEIEEELSFKDYLLLKASYRRTHCLR